MNEGQTSKLRFYKLFQKPFEREPYLLFNKITHIIHNLRVKYPEIKIIFCEITLRNDERERKVVICNRMLNTYAATQGYLLVAGLSNLRDDTCR